MKLIIFSLIRTALFTFLVDIKLIKIKYQLMYAAYNNAMHESVDSTMIMHEIQRC